jgi:hypothetical protein
MPASVFRGTEPRAGVSLIEIDNDTDRTLTLYFQGPEVFKVVLGPGARAGCELASGSYVTAATWDGPDDRAFRGNAHFAGRYHTVFAVTTPVTCTSMHPIVRKLP